MRALELVDLAPLMARTSGRPAISVGLIDGPVLLGHPELSSENIREVSAKLSGTRKVVDIIFSYTNRNTDVTEKFFVRVDVTEEFPFLVTKLSPYYHR